MVVRGVGVVDYQNPDSLHVSFHLVLHCVWYIKTRSSSGQIKTNV